MWTGSVGAAKAVLDAERSLACCVTGGWSDAAMVNSGDLNNEASPLHLAAAISHKQMVNGSYFVEFCFLFFLAVSSSSSFIARLHRLPTTVPPPPRLSFIFHPRMDRMGRWAPPMLSTFVFVVYAFVGFFLRRDKPTNRLVRVLRKVSLLLAEGANSVLEDSQGWTPVMYADFGGRKASFSDSFCYLCNRDYSIYIIPP